MKKKAAITKKTHRFTERRQRNAVVSRALREDPSVCIKRNIAS